MPKYSLRGALALTASAIALTAGSVAYAAAAAPIQEETPDYGTRVAELTVVAKGGAVAAAPAKASLKATEPQAIVSRAAIDQFIPATADYTQIVNLTPSLAGTSSNGPGLGEAKNTLRGFKDGEYNITYDGIPWGDANGVTHHSTAFFPSSTIGAVVVDRGPGEASQLGQATFGGSVNLFSPEVSNTYGGSESLTAGSWNTFMSVTKFNTGDIKELNNAHLLFNFQALTTDGALTYNHAKAFNELVRGVFPLFGSWKLTGLATWNQTKINTNDNAGATLSQVALYGKNFALNNDPTTQNYWGYNRVTKNTWFNYLMLNGDITDTLKLENKIYSYYYKNDTESTVDPTLDLTNPANHSSIKLPGYTKLNVYRIQGDILHLNQDLPFGQLRTGIWLEEAFTGPRARYDYNAINGAIDLRQTNPTAHGFNPPRNIEYIQYSGWKQYQPFVDLEWRVTPKLTITPGLKYMNFDLSVNTDINQKSREPFHGSRTFSKTLYFLTANYKVLDNLAVYAQYATGMLVPDISITQFVGPDLSAIQPQTSTNYQFGGVYHSNKLSLDADVYYIDFKNKLQQVKVGSGASTTEAQFNIGGAVYKGIEAQATYQLTPSLYIFGNGSLNSAKTKGLSVLLPAPVTIVANKQVAGAPVSTAGLGVIYKVGGLSVSLVDKYVGESWANEGEPSNFKVAGYHSADLTAVYNFGRYRVEGAVYNLTDSRKVTSIKPVNKTNVTSTFDQYYYQPERNFQVSLKASF